MGLSLHTHPQTGTLLAFSSSLAMYMALRVIIGFASMTVAVVSFVLVVELVSGKWRTVIGILNILPVAVTYVLTAGISYFVRDWRTLQLVISLPWFAILCIWWVAFAQTCPCGQIKLNFHFSTPTPTGTASPNRHGGFWPEVAWRSCMPLLRGRLV